MPLYNSEKFIAASIASVQAQTFTDWELIVVDDGSTDCSASIVKKMVEKDERVRLFQQINSGRPAVPRNFGINMARGEYIGFLDSDDLYHPQRLEQLMEVFKCQPEFDFVFHDFKQMDIDGRLFNQSYLTASIFKEYKYKYMYEQKKGIYACPENFYNFISTEMTSIWTSAVLVRKIRLKEEPVFFPEELIIGEDIDLWFRLVKDGSVAYIDNVLSYYRQHDKSITKNIEKMFKGFIAAHSMNYYRGKGKFTRLEDVKYRKRISDEYFHLGYYYFRKGQLSLSRTSYFNCFFWTKNMKALYALFKTIIFYTKLGFNKNL